MKKLHHSSFNGATYVLIPGAFQGSWCFDKLKRLLRSRGHQVFTPEPAGYGENSGIEHTCINATCHVDAVCKFIENTGLIDVVVCGHSYGGMIATTVADRMPHRIGALVLLDAPLPINGMSILDLVGERNEAAAIQITKDAVAAGGVIRPEPAQRYNVAPADAECFNRNAKPQPLATFTEPFKITGRFKEVALKVHVLATGWDSVSLLETHEALRRAGWATYKLAAGHWLMLDAPRELGGLLEDTAKDLRRQALSRSDQDQ